MTKTPKDDGTRSGRMEGPRLPRVQKSQGMTLEEAAKLPPIPDDIAKRFTATSVVRPSQIVQQILYEDKVPLRDQKFPGIDFETRSDVPLDKPVSQQVIEAAMARWPGQTLEYVDLPDGAVGLRPYQREMLRYAMETTPEFETPVEGDTYKDFVDRYAKGDVSPTGRHVGKHPALGAPYGRGGPSRRYGGKMSDMLRQSSYPFASGSADFMRKADAMRRFYVLGGGEGNRQLAYYAYGMALSQTADNWVDDVYDRKQRRAEAKLREYCMADVWIAADYAAIERRIIFTLLDGYPTVDVTHRLKAPYGREPSSTDWGIAISIRFTGLRPRGFVQDEPLAEWPDRQLADMIGGAVTGFGCPEFISRKVADTVYASGRYDCCITLSKLALLNLQSVMQELRCEVVVVCDDRRGWRGLPRYAPDSDKDMR